ncbi:hypothetical protein EW026_g8443, partial [Hermanssonia centrifuga]
EQASDYITVGMTALVAYEYIITIGAEVSLIWRRAWTGAVWLFIANRYLMVVSAAVETIPVNSFVSWHILISV